MPIVNTWNNQIKRALWLKLKQKSSFSWEVQKTNLEFKYSSRKRFWFGTWKTCELLFIDYKSPLAIVNLNYFCQWWSVAHQIELYVFKYSSFLYGILIYFRAVVVQTWPWIRPFEPLLRIWPARLAFYFCIYNLLVDVIDTFVNWRLKCPGNRA